MSDRAKRISSLSAACVVGLLAVLVTFATATASAPETRPRLDGFERQGVVWVKAAARPAVAAPASGPSGFRRDGRLWTKESRGVPRGQGLSLAFTKTVGTDLSVCATTDTVAVPSGTQVAYCFFARNTGAVTLATHTVVDDQLGTVLGPDFPASVAPGGAAFFTVAQVMGTMDVLNTATWSADDAAGTPTEDTDTALVTILQPSVAFTKTVGLVGSVCAGTQSISVSPGTTVYYCYFLRNNGQVTLSLHDVVDDQLGTILGPGFPAIVSPGNSAFFTVSAPITADVVNTATWTAYNAGPVDVAVGTDTAEVTVVVPVELIGFDVE